MRRNIKLGIMIGGLLGLFALLDPIGLIGAQEQVLPRPGLNVEITGATIPESRKPEVSFTITDERGTPLDRTGMLTEGVVNLRFLIARIKQGERQYTSYIVRSATGEALGTVDQATSDSGGTFTEVGPGQYTYQYGTTLPADYSRTVTHTVGVYASRDISYYDGNTYVAAATYDFVPNGSQVTVIRDVVNDQACNQCHQQLTGHGGRRSVALCILCHTPQTADPDSGNTVDFKVMVHKIHSGANLPSVQAGKPYRFITCCGVSDFSTVRFPQSVLNCRTCHAGSQGTNAYSRPSRAACGSCHDNVNFATGVGHGPGLPQTTDNICNFCHAPTSGSEFDISVTGAHVIPEKSQQLPGVKYEIVSVENTNPGQNLSVVFNIKDKNGNTIQPNQMSQLSLNYAGPAKDYAANHLEDARMAMAAGANFRYTFAQPIPPDASGTYTVGIEGHRDVRINGPDGPLTVRDAGANVTSAFAVTGQLAPRRSVVDVANCNACHNSLRLHESRRVDNPQYCVMCHNPNHIDDNPQDGLPGQSVDFKFMIHRIHAGEELTQDYSVGTTNFNDVGFPAPRQDCNICHLQGTQLIGSTAGRLPTLTPRSFIDPTPPISTACTGCHDSTETLAHVAVNSSGVLESCSICHGEGRDFAVSKVHFRRPDAR